MTSMRLKGVFVKFKEVRRLLFRKSRWLWGVLGLVVVIAACLALMFPVGYHCPRPRMEGEAEPSPFPWDPLSMQHHHNHNSTLENVSTTSLTLRNIVFAIQSSSQVWLERKEIIKLWFKPGWMRGFIWVEKAVMIGAEDQFVGAVMVSDDSYPAGVRLSRMLLNTFRLHPPHSHWFVLCEDDTVFSVQNLMDVLSKYDPTELVYIGGKSESHLQNHGHSHDMAFGGAGIAISYGLAAALSNMLESCLERYPQVLRNENRLHACITELGVPLTREPGFHQFDIRGNPFGILSAHPVAPFISMHHVDLLDPVFPGMRSLDSLRLFMSAMETEPASFLQQSICYNHTAKLSFSVSLGYVVQVFPYILLPRELQDPEITFRAWNWRTHVGEFAINSRPSARSICDRPFLFYLTENYFHEDTNKILSIYNRYQKLDEQQKAVCRSRMLLREIQQVQVLHKPFRSQWHLVPRRQCCNLGGAKNGILTISVHPCKQGQWIYS